MYAPAFPRYRVPKPFWHIAHPLWIAKAYCNHRVVLNGTKAADVLPDGAELCPMCEQRQHFVDKLTGCGGQGALK